MKTSLKTLKKHARKPEDLDAGFNDKTPIVYAHRQQFDETPAHEVINLRHTGWYTDIEGRCSAVGIVASFPARPGFPEGWHLAGYRWTENDERVFYLDVFSDKEEAARYADRYAERFADDEREYNQKWQEARDIERKIEELSEECRKLVALRNNARFKDARGEARELIQKIREKRETLETDFADYV